MTDPLAQATADLLIRDGAQPTDAALAGLSPAQKEEVREMMSETELVTARKGSDMQLPPPLDVNDEDRKKSTAMFDIRPTSLLITREGQDTFLLKAGAEIFCRERQITAALQRIAVLEETLGEARKGNEIQESELDGLRKINKELHEANFRQATKIDEIAGLRNAYYVRLAKAFGLNPENDENPGIPGLITAAQQRIAVLEEDNSRLREELDKAQLDIKFLRETNEFQFNEIIRVIDLGNERVRIWQQELEMYQNAWLRELGGKLVPKHHFIDALVLTTRNLFKSKEDLESQLDAFAPPPSLDKELVP